MDSLSYPSTLLFLANLMMLPWRQIWKKKPPPHIPILACEAAWGRLLTYNKPKRKGRIIANGCQLCLLENKFLIFDSSDVLSLDHHGFQLLVSSTSLRWPTVCWWMNFRAWNGTLLTRIRRGSYLLFLWLWSVTWKEKTIQIFLFNGNN